MSSGSVPATKQTGTVHAAAPVNVQGYSGDGIPLNGCGVHFGGAGVKWHHVKWQIISDQVHGMPQEPSVKWVAERDNRKIFSDRHSY